MSLDYKAMEKKLDEFVNSPAGIAFFKNEQKKRELKTKRYVRFEEWLKHNDFEKLIQRLILEHGDGYREKCYHKGYEPYPNNKLSFIIDYLVHNYDTISVSELENMFSTSIWFFKGYYFRLMYGQGTVFDLYNGSDFKHLLSA